MIINQEKCYNIVIILQNNIGLGYNTYGLLTVTENHFKTSLDTFPNFWGAEQLWVWITNWKRRNVSVFFPLSGFLIII